MRKNYSDNVVLIHQWRRSSTLSHSWSFHFVNTMMLIYTLLLLMSTNMKTEAHETDYDYAPSWTHPHLNIFPVPCLDGKMREYHTNENEKEIPSSPPPVPPSHFIGDFLLKLRDSPSRMESVSEFSHLVNWKSRLGVIHNHGQEKESSPSMEVPKLETFSLFPVTPLKPNHFTNIQSLMNEIQKRKKKGFSVISRFLVSPNRKGGGIGPNGGGGVQQRSFLNENDSMTSIQMRRSSVLRPFRMRLRWG